MTKKRYYSVDYDEQYYIFDSNIIRKGRVEEEAEYSYDVFADSMSSDEIVDLLNEQDEEITELKILSTKLYAENVILQTKLDTIKNCVNNLEDD